MMDKKPYLFYHSEAVDAYIPIDWCEIEDDLTSNLLDGETIMIEFKVVEMTEKQFKELPEA